MYSDTNDITVIILAGGLGRRMNGKNKGLISISGKTLLEHTLDQLKPQTQNILINANRDLTTYQLNNLPVIRDKFTGNQGPLAGILSCRDKINTQLILTVPCDTPLLPENLIHTMLAAYKQNTPEALCVAHDGQRLQNLFMLFNKNQFDHLNAFFHQDNRKVNDWIQSQPYKPVDFSNQHDQFININTEKDLISFQRSTLPDINSDDIK